MKFRKLLRKDPNLSQVTMISFLNIIFLLFAFFMFASEFNVTAGLNVNFPSVLGSNDLNGALFSIKILGDGEIYVQDKPVGIKGLKPLLTASKCDSILIKADRKTSLEVVTDIWNICRDVGIKKIGIITTFN